MHELNTTTTQNSCKFIYALDETATYNKHIIHALNGRRVRSRCAFIRE